MLLWHIFTVLYTLILRAGAKYHYTLSCFTSQATTLFWHCASCSGVRERKFLMIKDFAAP